MYCVCVVQKDIIQYVHRYDVEGWGGLLGIGLYGEKNGFGLEHYIEYKVQVDVNRFILNQEKLNGTANKR